MLCQNFEPRKPFIYDLGGDESTLMLRERKRKEKKRKEKWESKSPPRGCSFFMTFLETFFKLKKHVFTSSNAIHHSYSSFILSMFIWHGFFTIKKTNFHVLNVKEPRYIHTEENIRVMNRIIDQSFNYRAFNNLPHTLLLTYY